MSICMIGVPCDECYYTNHVLNTWQPVVMLPSMSMWLFNPWQLLSVTNISGPRAHLWRSKTVMDCANLWRFSNNRHARQSMTLNPWRYLKPSQMLFCDDYLAFCDGFKSSCINRFLVVRLTQLVGWEVLLYTQPPNFKSFLGLNLGSYFSKNI
jgi:hypothetical protein